jgi:curved DNA-binding protein CbpA
MNAPDLYRLLQVDTHAEPDVIKAAYRTLAARHHPDVGGSTERMTELNLAWSVLSDPGRRADYDRQRRVLNGGDRWDAYGATTRAAEAAQATGTILEFGRYAGWSVPQVAVCDRDYLEWLVRTPNGRRYRDEIETSLGSTTTATATATMVRPTERRSTRRLSSRR